MKASCRKREASARRACPDLVVEDNPRLGPGVRGLIADASRNVLFSAASCWEASLKQRKGKLDIFGSVLWRLAIDEGFEAIGVRHRHVAEMEALPRIDRHGDPFDLLLLAQAKVENTILMTADRHMTRYGVPCVGVR